MTGVVERLRRVPVARLAAFIAAATYGTVLVLATLSAISVAQVSMGHGLELIAGVGVATWVAHLFAELLGGHVARQRPLDRDEVHEAIIDASPILVSTVMPAVALGLGRLDVVSDSAARTLAIVTALVQLMAIGTLAGHIGSTRRAALWIFGMITLAIGLLVAVVTTWLGGH